MAQEDYVISDQTGVSFLADLNNTLAAIVSNNSGVTEPATMYAYQLWADTNAGILKQRNSANNAWINILTLAGIKSSDIRNTASSGIASTTVQAALNELSTDKAALSGGAFSGNISAPKITASLGILFGTDTAAANTLDDYEEGTWTPSQTSVGAVAFIGAARYTKIGNLVYFIADVQTATSSNTSQFNLSVPFTPIGFNTVQSFACSIGFTSSSATVVEVKGGEGIILREIHGGSNLTNANVSNKRLVVSGNYTIA